MLLDTRERLDEKIVERLATTPAQTAEDLRLTLRNGDSKYTIQAIYQELRNLRRAGVVIKSGDRYNLWAPWVIRLMDFTDKLSLIYHDPNSFEDLIPKPGQSKSWRFDNLVRLARFWGQTLSILVKHTESKHLITYSPHQWHYIVRGENMKKINESLLVSNINTYTIIGSDTPLDRWAEQFWRHEGNYSFEDSVFHSKRNEHLSAVGDFVVTLKLSKALELKLENMYKSVVTPQFIDFGDLYELFSSDARSTLKIQHNPIKAKQVRRKFSDHFGVGLLK